MRSLLLIWVAEGHRVYHGAVVLLSLATTGAAIHWTLSRLRTLGLPCWPAALMLVPLVGAFLVSVLVILKAEHEIHTRESPAGQAITLPGGAADPQVVAYSSARIPDLAPAASARGLAGRWLWGLAAATLPAVLGAVHVAMGTTGLRSYGVGLFIGVPLVLSFAAAGLHSLPDRRGFGECLAVGVWAELEWGFILLLTGFEGAVCLMMAAPLVLVCGLLGALVAHAIQDALRFRGNFARLVPIVVLFAPGLMGAEKLVDPDPPMFAVRTSVEVNAPPETVWRHVIDFPELSAPSEWYFRAGIAYPTCARINGRGVGAVRECVFTTGSFVEPVTAWDEPRLLAFDVTAQPPPMREWSFRDVHPPHLDGFLVSQRGQFRLEAQPNGRTRLEGTTWYRHSMWPAAYWRLWSDFLIHRIHQRVLRHVQTLAEGDAA
jgi:hypothetical protein